MKLFKKKVVQPKEEPIRLFSDIPLQERGIEWDLPISPLTGRPYDPELIERRPLMSDVKVVLGFHTPQDPPRPSVDPRLIGKEAR